MPGVCSRGMLGFSLKYSILALWGYISISETFVWVNTNRNYVWVADHNSPIRCFTEKNQTDSSTQLPCGVMPSDVIINHPDPYLSPLIELEIYILNLPPPSNIAK